MRIIDADELKALRELYIQGKLQFVENEYDLIDKCPTIDAEPVRHGRWRFDSAWMNEDGVVNDYFCSCCGRIISVDCKAELENYPYCHCGAKMDLKE